MTGLRRGSARWRRRTSSRISSPPRWGEAEIATEVRLPALDGYGHGYQKFNRRQEDWAMVAVCALVKKASDGSCEDVRIGLDQHGHRAAAGERGRGGAPRDSRWTRSGIAAAAEQAAEGTWRPRDLNASAEYKQPPPARALPEGARTGGGRGRVGRPSSSEACASSRSTDVTRALDGESYLADGGWRRPRSSPVTLEQPLLLEGEAGVGKTEVAGAGGGDRGGADPPAVHEGIDLHHAVYDWDYQRQLLAIRAAEAGARAAGALRARVPAAPPAARGARARRPGRAADRRGRPRRRRVRGLPARVPLGLPALDPRARHGSPASGRSSC